MVSNNNFSNDKITFCYYDEKEFRNFISSLEKSEQNKLLEAIKKIKLYGFAYAFKQQWIKKIRNKKTDLFEIRANGYKTIQRAVFFEHTDGSYVITNVFVKKTQKTPKKEINKAISRKKKY